MSIRCQGRWCSLVTCAESGFVAGFGAWRMRIAEYYNRSKQDGSSAVASMVGGSLNSCAVEFDEVVMQVEVSGWDDDCVISHPSAGSMVGLAAGFVQGGRNQEKLECLW